MSVAKVLKLEEHRDRRDRRGALARVIHGRHPERAALLAHFAEIADLTGADRVAAVWIDDYVSTLLHTHLVFDRLSDRPRRGFDHVPLHRAWDFGVPGAYDQAADSEASGSSTFAIALGSDGARSWFIVSDSVLGRTRLLPDHRDRLMFLAGACASIVLHRDLIEATPQVDPSLSFPGWPILQDLEGHEDDPARRTLIERRFQVGRLARLLLDEDLALPAERRGQLCDRAAGELEEGTDVEPRELESLRHFLEGFRALDLDMLGQALVSLAAHAERLDHILGALDLYDCAYEIGAAIGDVEVCIAAARSRGRVLRRRAEWDEAVAAYGLALALAEAKEDYEMIARSCAGLAVIQKERGNLPAARKTFGEALEAANTAGDGDTIASIYHDLMGLEHAAGELAEAARCGWRAVNTYADPVGKTRCLMSFATVLKELGDWDAAEDAYTVVAQTADEVYYSVYAHDALAHMAALRGDEAAFEERAKACDALGWEDGPRWSKAEILYYRGLSLHLLGRLTEARQWLERAVRFAEMHEFNQKVFEAEDALKQVTADVLRSCDPVKPLSTAPPEVRAELRAMRDEVVGVSL